jgi:hypothetical protein
MIDNSVVKVESQSIFNNCHFDLNSLPLVLNRFLQKCSQVTGIEKRIRVLDAEARAEVAKIEKQSELDILQLERAKVRISNQVMREQQNIEEIILKALPLLSEATAKPDEIQNDWIFNFFNKAQQFEDQDMQALWAKILAANQEASLVKQSIS